MHGALVTDQDAVLVLTFPRPERPLSLNEYKRLHWAAARKRLEPWRDSVTWTFRSVRPERRRLMAGRPAWVELELPFTDRRRRDPHNFVPVLKVVIDALTCDRHCKPGCISHLWPDDTPEWVRTVEPTLVVGTDAKVIVTAR